MQRILLQEVGNNGAVIKAAEVLRAGGVILYPTDTLYGLGADALSDEAVAKVQQIKGRDENKPIHAIVSGIQMAGEYGEVNDAARSLTEAFWPGALTLVLKKKDHVEGGIARNMETFGVRVPDNEFCTKLARAFGRPFTTTSANKSGETSERTVDGILTQLGSQAHAIDLIIDAGEISERLPSTVVDVQESEPRVLREGAIPTSAIHSVLLRSR